MTHYQITKHGKQKTACDTRKLAWFGTRDWSKVTCPACLATKPKPAKETKL